MNNTTFKIVVMGLLFVASIAGFLASATFWEVKTELVKLRTEMARISLIVDRHEMLLQMPYADRQKYYRGAGPGKAGD